MRTFYLLLLSIIVSWGCKSKQSSEHGKLKAIARLVPLESILEIGITNQSDKNIWLISGRSRMSISYEVYKDKKIVASAFGVDTPPYQFHGGLKEWSHLPSQNVNQAKEQYLIQFALPEDVWEDFKAGDEVRISLSATVSDESRSNNEIVNFPYQRLQIPKEGKNK
jgi:hypothetical protein